jgi:zinc transporter ZupT
MMRERISRTLIGSVRAFGFGAVAAALAGVIIFLLAFLISGMDAVLAGDWMKKALSILGSLGVIVGVLGMLMPDQPDPDEDTGVNDEKGREIAEMLGISWQTAVVLASLAILVVAYLFELVYRAFV